MYMGVKCMYKNNLHVSYSYRQPDQIYVAVFFCYLVKSGLGQCTLLYTRTLNKSRFARYQKYTAMHNWSPCS